MTLLASVNRVRRKLRDDEVTSLAANDLGTMTIVDSLNEAASELFSHRIWSFLRRDDGQLWFPGRFTATEGAGIAAHATLGGLNDGSNTWATSTVFDYTQRGQDGRLRIRMTWDEDTEHPNTSYIVEELSHLPGFPVRLADEFRGVLQTDAGFTLYSHEFVLPDTVRQVLSVRYEEMPLRLEFVDKDFDVYAGMPRATDWFGEPEAAYIGDTITGVRTDSGVVAQTGLGLTVWPIPDGETILKYSYVYRYADLSVASETWTGVPEEHIRLVESMAFEKCLDSNVEDDPRRGAALRAKNEAMLARLVSADQRGVNQRRVTPELGGPGSGTRIMPRYQIVLND